MKKTTNEGKEYKYFTCYEKHIKFIHHRHQQFSYFELKCVCVMWKRSQTDR